MRTPDTSPNHGGEQARQQRVANKGAVLRTTLSRIEAEEVAKEREAHANPQTPAEASLMRARILESERRLKDEPAVERPVDVRSIRIDPHNLG